jgi:hypothetical protein
MKIYCVCVVKNEDDVLGEVIAAATQWADRIFIADHQSTDRTADVIASLVRKHSNVVDVGHLTEPFSDAIRATVFQRAGGISVPGDWWCGLDADEFYLDDPRQFLAEVPSDVDTVWTSHFQFYFTDRDFETYQADPRAFMAVPVRERIKYYRNNSSEIRFVKHTRPFVWHNQWPYLRCSASRKRIRVAHYQYRSPLQIAKRLQVRRLVLQQTGGRVFGHEGPTTKSAVGSLDDLSIPADPAHLKPEHFIEKIAPAHDLDHSADGQLVDREEGLMRLPNVRPGAVPSLVWRPYCATTGIARLVLRRLGG